MQEALVQEEVVRLEDAATDKPSSKPVDRMFGQVRKWEIQPAETLDGEQLSSVSALQERCARAIAEQLGSYLRAECEGTLVSVEQQAAADYVHRFPEPAYFVTLDLAPHDEAVILQIDSGLAFFFLDVMLGGTGQTEYSLREFTEIEEQLLATVVTLVTQSVQRSCSAAGAKLEFSFRKRQSPQELFCVWPQSETALVTTFEIRMNEMRGQLTIAFPASASRRIFHIRTDDAPAVRRHGSASESVKLKQRLLGCQVCAELVLIDGTLPADSLLNMKIGSILNLGKSSEEPISVIAGGTETFSAYPVSSGNCRAALLHGRVNSRNTTCEVNHE